MAEIVTLKLRQGDKEKLRIALKGLSERTVRNIPIVLKQAGLVGVNFCKLECPVDLGGLRASIGNPQKEGIFDVTRNRVVFGTAVNYALPVELGTKAYWISPKPPKGYLAWKDKETGKWIYTKKKVKHPAMKGKHFMLKGVQKAVPSIIKVLKGIIKIT